MVRCYCGLDFYPKDGYDTEFHLGSSEHLKAIQGTENEDLFERRLTWNNDGDKK